jgi:hypothetical protein
MIEEHVESLKVHTCNSRPEVRFPSWLEQTVKVIGAVLGCFMGALLIRYVGAAKKINNVSLLNVMGPLIRLIPSRNHMNMCPEECRQ